MYSLALPRVGPFGAFQATWLPVNRKVAVAPLPFAWRTASPR